MGRGVMKRLIKSHHLENFTTELEITPSLHGAAYTNNFSTTSPDTSVNRKSRPWNR